MGSTTLHSTLSKLIASVRQWVALPILGPAAGYLLLVALLRFRRLKRTQREFNYSTRECYAKMTDNDAWKIQTRIAELEFPYIYLKALQFALFRTYGIPSISKTLVHTSQFSKKETSTKRYADTSVLLGEFIGNEPASLRAREGIARMNFIHSTYRKSGKILDDDMLFTLSLFAVEPVRWINRYEWREISELEKCALGTFWKSIGDAMEISYERLPSFKKGFKDGLQWLEEAETWSREYERKMMVPNWYNKETADQTVAVLLWEIPSLLKPAASNMISFLMDDRLREAMMYDRPGPLYARIFSAVLSARKFFLRYLALPRPHFMRINRMSDKPDEQGRYFFTDWEGAPFYVKPTLVNRWGFGAWITWLRGLPLPGDDGDTYYPKGYFIPDVGPKAFEGKGADYFQETVERLEKERTGQCPFAVLP